MLGHTNWWISFTHSVASLFAHKLSHYSAICRWDVSSHRDSNAAGDFENKFSGFFVCYFILASENPFISVIFILMLDLVYEKTH